MENSLDYYEVNCTEVFVANETFHVQARSEEDAIATVKDLLNRGLKNTFIERKEEIVESKWFNYTAKKEE